MINLEFKVTETLCDKDFKVSHFEVFDGINKIGDLYENISIEFAKTLNWRLFLENGKDIKEFNNFYDAFNYISTL